MNGTLRSRRALLTGASRGIGAATALRFAAEGADVALVARTVEQTGSLPGSLEATAAQLEPFGGRIVVIEADLSDPAGRSSIVPRARGRSTSW